MTHQSRCHTWPAFNGDGPRSQSEKGFPVTMPWRSGRPPQLLEMKNTIRPPGTNIYPYSDLPWRGISLETMGKAPESHLNMNYFHCFTIKKVLINTPRYWAGAKVFNFIIFTFLGPIASILKKILEGHLTFFLSDQSPLMSKYIAWLSKKSPCLVEHFHI